MNAATTDIRDIDIIRTWCASSLLNYTRYMFRQKNGSRFIVGDHHRRICEALQRVIEGECRRLIINMPPRYGKTEIISKMFVGYGLALNPRAKFIEISYSDDLVLDNSREVNEMVRSDYHRRLFPECEAKNIAAKKWMTTAGGGVYAVSSGGQVTGFGAGQTAASIEEVAAELGGASFAGALIIDDFIKPDDALSDNIRTSANERFENTLRSRLNSRETPIVVVMQRVHEDDLCGHLLRVEGRKEEGGEWEVLSLPALSVDEEGREVALWPYKHTVEELHKLSMLSAFVFETQYQQNPKPLEGLMYGDFKTYDVLPIGRGVAKNYTDTADTGADFLCSICYMEMPQGLFVTDVVHTDRAMEYTEVAVAEMLDRNGTQVANIESNNGGRGFARNVERNLRELGNRTTAVRWFHQGNNKATRIATNAATVQNMVYFPSDWAQRWPTFAGALRSYRARGRNAHDDAPDALTGCVEQMPQSRGGGTRFSRT